MSQDRHEQIMRIVGDALELSADQRAALLDSACGGDPSLRAEVERLLRAEKSAVRAIPSAHPLAAGSSRPSPSPGMSSAELRSLIGTRVGAYELTGVLGHGGMGVVYRARDLRLGREVAVKAVPPSLTHDPTRLARFTREARVLASLTHPNIATVHGLEESESGQFLIMELISGETLAARLRRSGAMELTDALALGSQIAAALEAAHATGVVHRDLKPGNIMLTGEGTAKVLDFGLARELGRSALDEVPAETDLDITREGSVIGTPSYMSPEQLRGQPVDRRTDVFSFGCVLWECVTGRRAFGGETPTQIASAVLEREPDFSLLPAHTPACIRKLLQRCLMKDPQRRLRDLGDARLELEEALAAKEWQSPPPRQARRGSVGWWFAAAATGGAVILATLLLSRPEPAMKTPGGSLERLSIPLPIAQTDLARLRVALSRNGQTAVVSAWNATGLHLWVREKGQSGFRRLENTENGMVPSLSPDGRWVTYFNDGMLMKGRTTGGSSYKICNVPGYWGGYWWGHDGMITFAPQWGAGLAQISAEGGVPKTVTQMRHDLKEQAQLSPCVLPDNRTVLVTLWDGRQNVRITAIDLVSGDRRTVMENAATPRIAQTPGGDFLLFERANTIYAAPFDVRRASVTGMEVAVADGVLTDRNLFTACYDVGDDGTILYVPGGIYWEQSRLHWLNADGSTTPFNDDYLPFSDPNFSDDGQKLLVTVKADQYKSYLYDLQRGTFEQISIDGDAEFSSISGDGKRLFYCTNVDGPYSLWLRNLETNQDEKLIDGGGDCPAQPSWSPDGRFLTFSMSPPERPVRDIWLIDLQTRSLTPFCNTPGEERNPVFSPDGKWVAYTSDLSGIREVYLKSFPDGQQTRQMTFGGGDWPAWSPDGAKLYHVRKGNLYSLQVSEDGTLTGRPTVVYDKSFGHTGYEDYHYTVAPDGRILLILRSDRGATVSHLNVVQNFHLLLAGQPSAGR